MPELLNSWQQRNISCEIRNAAKHRGMLAKFSPDGSWRLYRGTELVSSGDGMDSAEVMDWLLEHPEQAEADSCPTCGQTKT